MLYLTFLAKKKGEKEAFIDNLANSLVLITSISINLLIISNLGFNFIVFPFDILMLFFIISFFPIFYILIIHEKRKIRKGEKIIDFPKLISDIFFSIYNIEKDKMIFTQYLVVFLVGVSLIGLLTADFVRILKPEQYPLKSVNQILKEKERSQIRLGPQISMAVGCFSIIILFGTFQPIGPLIICTSMTMAILGDIASNLIGRTIGSKYKNIRNTKKTYIGLSAGIIVSYLSGIIILIILRGYFDISLLFFVLIPLIGAIIIGLLDYLDLEIDDNLSFNFIVTTVLFFIAILIGE